MPEQTLVSVDLDGIGCYHAIHGLAPPGPQQHRVVLARCLPRFLDLFARLRVRATFFVIGRDLEAELVDDGPGAAALRRALDEGHELGNHSHAHAYDLVTAPAGRIFADLRACDAVLRGLGAKPAGFRAPGYTHSRAMLACVQELGYAYDSSALPSPPYYLAKVAAIGWHALRGRRSRSMVRGAGSFLGARTPVRVRDLDLWELPVSVTPALRIPLIGTTLLSGPGWLRVRLRRAAEALPHFHLELHGLDLADPEVDGYAAPLRRLQPELRTSLADKRDALAGLLRARGPTTRQCDAIPAVSSRA